MTHVFDSLLAWLHAMGDATNSPVVLLMLAAAAGIEYIIPPFPGDSITLLGGVLVSAFSWSFALVFTAIMVGAVSGSMVSYALGRRLRERKPRLAEGDGKLARLVCQFGERGTWFLFVAAGLGGMPAKRVAILSAVSAALWNLAIMAAGAVVGDNLDRLEELLVKYSTIAWIVMIVGILLVALRAVLRRSRSA